MTPNPQPGFGVSSCAGWPGWASGGLVAAGGVEFQVLACLQAAYEAEADV
jgi:hypothetical protein